MKEIELPVPPALAEQRAIVGRLDAETASVTAAISRLDREIDFLREYRIRLVADVVTGKRLAEWGSDDDESDDEEGSGKKGLPEKKRQKLLDPKTWERDARRGGDCHSVVAELGRRAV